MRHNPSLIERLAETLHLIPDFHGEDGDDLPPIMEPGELTSYPPPGETGRLGILLIRTCEKTEYLLI